MTKDIQDAIASIQSELEGVIAEVEDLPESDERDNVLGILDVMKEDLTEARRQLSQL
jgi:hypothetical protein